MPEMCDRIVKLVRQYESCGGVTKNEVCETLKRKYYGSRSTYWKCFKYLLGTKGGNLIECRSVPSHKIHGKLFPTDTGKRLEEFKEKISCVEKMLDMIEDYPLVGDYYNKDGISIELNRSKTNIPHIPRKIAYIVGTSIYEMRAYSLQARHDLLEKLPLFLNDYILDPKNNLNSISNDCMDMYSPIISRCISLQKDYSDYIRHIRSVTGSQTENIRVYDAKGQDMQVIEIEFLRILGRYYFLISLAFSEEFGIDSSKEQMIVSSFLKEFFPRKKLEAKEDINPYKYAVQSPVDVYLSMSQTAKKYGELKFVFDEDLKNQFDKLTKRMSNMKNYKMIIPPTSYNMDPVGISEYYLRWMFHCKIFSVFEMKIISIVFVSVVTENKDMYKNYFEDMLSEVTYD